MTSYRRSALLPRLWCAGESRGAYDPGDGERGDHDRAAAAAAAVITGGGGREAGGARDADDPGPAGGSPLPRLLDRLEALEQAKRDMLDTLRDVAACHRRERPPRARNEPDSPAQGPTRTEQEPEASAGPGVAADEQKPRVRTRSRCGRIRLR